MSEYPVLFYCKHCGTSSQDALNCEFCGADIKTGQKDQRWNFTRATKVVAPLWSWGDFVISCRPACFTVSLRPTGKHIPIGQFTTLAAAKEAAGGVDLLALAYDGKVQQL